MKRKAFSTGRKSVCVAPRGANRSSPGCAWDRPGSRSIRSRINTRMDNAFYDELGGSMASDD
ncbi:putative thiol:disulfide interchange protein [Pseudomonas aeruginosa 39016]|nr:putative thiol:disulfide interchange protein [Pseudomonas aeruginosa 39016]BAR67712.1 hypothetical protein PA8380_28860 [Pseudomonas aeruginosa]